MDSNRDILWAVEIESSDGEKTFWSPLAGFRYESDAIFELDRRTSVSRARFRIGMYARCGK